MIELVLMIHWVSTALMTGIIWFVQIIHYPLFAKVGTESFTDYEQAHVDRTKYLIVPLMLIEITSAGVLLLNHSSIPFSVIMVNFVLLLLIWASTFFIQVPLHGKLSNERSLNSIKRLVRSNWLRTVLWTFRILLLSSLIILYK
jgi:hypothetical protein